MRQAFYHEVSAVLADDPRTALVLADISAAALATSAQRHPDRVHNVGIREQLMISVASGLALTGMRPIAHSYAPFLIERAWEQVKLDLGHQGVGAILVSVGASYDSSASGRTHHAPGDVALLDTLDGWTVHVPGHPGEVGPALRAATAHDEPVYIRLAERTNDTARSTRGELMRITSGGRATIIAVGPLLDPVLAATAGLDESVVYCNTPRPFDSRGLSELLPHNPTRGSADRGSVDVIVVEPYLAGTSAHQVSAALSHIPHRLLSLGVSRRDLHRYGTSAEHDRAHGLDPAGIRAAITTFVAAYDGIAPAAR